MVIIFVCIRSDVLVRQYQGVGVSVLQLGFSAGKFYHCEI
jgi:hypothetical protein